METGSFGSLQSKRNSEIIEFGLKFRVEEGSLKKPFSQLILEERLQV